MLSSTESPALSIRWAVFTKFSSKLQQWPQTVPVGPACVPTVDISIGSALDLRKMIDPFEGRTWLGQRYREVNTFSYDKTLFDSWETQQIVELTFKLEGAYYQSHMQLKKFSRLALSYARSINWSQQCSKYANFNGLQKLINLRYV